MQAISRRQNLECLQCQFRVQGPFVLVADSIDGDTDRTLIDSSASLLGTWIVGRTKVAWDSAGTVGSAIRTMLAMLGNSNSIFHLLYK